jgi:phytoene synthase
MMKMQTENSHMTVNTMRWENHLVALAQDAQANDTVTKEPLAHNEHQLEQAYQYCEALTKHHSKTFYIASSLISKPKRRAIRALYAFCRVSDDLVDQPTGDVLAQLEDWRRKTIDPCLCCEDPVSLAWNDTCQRFQIPLRYAEQLLDGVAKDVNNVRYETFEDLSTYCYGVASTVGLMAMNIIGYQSQDAIIYAIRLGVALQLTNILRDIGEDWHFGRLYLSKQEMEAFGLTEEDITRGEVTPAWREFMRFQIDRTRKLYADSVPGVGLLDRDGRFAIAAASELYQAILEQIEKLDYDVFHHRAMLSAWGKVKRLPGIWYRANYRYHPIPVSK